MKSGYTEEQKAAIADHTILEVCSMLFRLWSACELKTHITCEAEYKGEWFKLSFERINEETPLGEETTAPQQ